VAEVGSVPERRTFDETWCELRDRLARVLAARGVPVQDREDLLQDTALRLYRVWDGLDPEQPVWPYAVTIALNLWRDNLRAMGTHVREVSATASVEAVADLDVERTVIARQELAHVGAALRGLAPEQRRLVLETDELTSVVRPLRAAERMSRMRVRRELARVVGRASAVAALIWLRRPHRAQAAVAAAFTGALAATLFTGSPAVSVTAVAPFAPAVVAPVAATATHPAAVVRPAVLTAVHHAAARPALRVRHPAKPAPLVCAPAAAGPVPQSDPPPAPDQVPVSTAGTVVTHALGVHPSVTVPTARASDSGCVEVS
jgi:RNA polymerase sigma factor (sigma-70 family)